MSETREQLAVVNHTGGHALVSAVAGSGKTRTLIARIIKQLQRGVDPRRILVLMFNRSAADDFSIRLKTTARDLMLATPDVRTFHAFGKSVCEALENQGLIPIARLITKDYELRKIMRDVLDGVNSRLPPADRFDTANPEVLETALDVIDQFKNELIPHTPLFKRQPVRWQLAFSAWESRRLDGTERFRSFTDLLYDPVDSMVTNVAVHNFVTNHYNEIMVDEFQDTNDLQVVFLQHIAGTRGSITAVGDEDQCIYGFRAAKPEFMTHKFEDLFPNTTRFGLTASFRYGHQVALLANNSIQLNKQRTDKICVSASKHQTDISLIMAKANPHQEVITALKNWVASGRRLSECAILIREFSHGSLTETALMRENIPYRLVGNKVFFERREILAMRAAMTIATDTWENVQTDELRHSMIEALLTVPPLYLKRYELDSLIKMASASERPHEVLAKAISVKRGPNKGYAGRHYQVFCDHIENCTKANIDSPAASFIANAVLRLDLTTVFAAAEASHQAAQERLQLLFSFAKIADQDKLSIKAFNELIETLSTKIGKGAEHDSVLLTSIHRTKGLEYPHVIIPELSDNRFPSDHDAMEDERRLFYVAVTRAQERLTLISPYDQLLLSWIKERLHGAPGVEVQASRFLYEASPLLARDAAQAIAQDTSPLTPAIMGKDENGAHRKHLERYTGMVVDVTEMMAANAAPHEDNDQESIQIL